MAATPAAATVLEVESTQVGGFYDDGTADNSPTFQNYFVGHTSLAGTLFPERRNFFIFDLRGVTGEIASAELLLPTPAGGYIGVDPSEDYALTGTSFDPVVIADPAAPTPVKLDIFDSLGAPAAPLYALVTLTSADFPTFPGAPGELTLPLSPAAVFDLNAGKGGLFALGGRMATHDFDELDELLFAFSDVVSGSPLVDEPVLSLTIESAPIATPEPATVALIALGLVGLASHARRREPTRAA